MGTFRFVRKNKGFDKKKWVEITDTEVIQEIAKTEYYEKIPGTNMRALKSTFIYSVDLAAVEDGEEKFLCSTSNLYLNKHKYKKDMENLISELKKDKHLAIAMYKHFFPKATEKPDIKHFNSVPFNDLKEAVDTYNKDLKDQF